MVVSVYIYKYILYYFITENLVLNGDKSWYTEIDNSCGGRARTNIGDVLVDDIHCVYSLKTKILED